MSRVRIFTHSFIEKIAQVKLLKIQNCEMSHRMKIKTMAQTCLDILDAHKNKIVVCSSSIVLAFSSVWVAQTYYQSQVETIYHVYFDNEKVGIVNQPEVVEGWLDSQVNELAEEFEHVTLLADQEITFDALNLYKPDYNNEEVIANIEQNLKFKAKAYEVHIDGELIGYAPSEDSISHILDEIKRDFVSEEQWLAYNENLNRGRGVAVATVDPDETTVALAEPQMVDINIKQLLKIEEQYVNPDQVLDEDKIKDLLRETRLEEKKHTVATGDVLGVIASKYELSLNDILNLNPELNESSVLTIGSQVIVEGEVPMITVITEEVETVEEEIDFEVITKKDSSMYRGDTKVEQEGSKGLKHVEYKIVKENGQQIQRQVNNEEIISEPVEKIVIEGDKIKPSRGTGQFGWPTVGGYVSSPFGMRWGRLHAGIDIGGNSVSNRTILASDNGTVVTAGWHNGGYGNYVIIDHDNGYRTLYAHLSSIGVSRGEVVKKGDSVGVMGRTGQSTGVHLHFEIHKNGRNSNPMTYLR